MSYNFPINCQFNYADINGIYEDTFGPDKTDGFFVEVGASDGESYSNTCGLADKGWSGIYVEPVRELAAKCGKRHEDNDVVVMEAAAGGNYHQGVLYMIPEWGTVTSNRHAAEAISKKPTEYSTPVVTLDSILELGAVPYGFDLLVIDVDFGEVEVLRGFSIWNWTPKLVIIELHDEHQPLSHAIQAYALPYFEEFGYARIYKDGINSIFRKLV